MKVTNPDPLSTEKQLSYVTPDVHLSQCPVSNKKQIMGAVQKVGQKKYVTLLSEIYY